MKTILFILSFFIFQFGYSQETRVEYKSYTTKLGDVITDTVWQVKRIQEVLDQNNGKMSPDTSWVDDRRTYHIKEYRNPTVSSTSKGNVSIAVLFNKNFTNEDNYTQFRIGYFTSNNFLLGAGLFGKYDFDASDLSVLQLSLFGRQYLGGNKSKAFLEGGLDADITSGDYYLGLGVGKTFFVGSNFGVDVGLKYLTDFQASGSLVFGLAFQGILPAKK